MLPCGFHSAFQSRASDHTPANSKNSLCTGIRFRATVLFNVDEQKVCLHLILPSPARNHVKFSVVAVPGVVTKDNMIILAPESPKPAPAPIKPISAMDYFDRKLIEAVSQPDNQPVPLWPTIHKLVEAEGPADRARRRQLCSRLLCRLRGLIRARKIVRESKSHVRLATPSPAPSPTPLPTPKPVKNWPPAPDPTVGDWASFYPGGPSRRVFRV